jgi:hypothetical protein
MRTVQQFAIKAKVMDFPGEGIKRFRESQVVIQ